MQNKSNVKINDASRNTGESEEYTVRVGAADPPAPVISSSTHPDAGVDITENRKV
ncbi:MAG: hypothetical protein U9N36_00375 [Euryarchaeota archaeon]|nr:hypothetical protein [Euryarchaeota archaeon]